MSQLELVEPCADWDEHLLSDVARTTSGGTPDRSKKDFYNGTIPWVKSGELDDNFLDCTEEHICEEGIKKSSAKLFPAGTLLMAMYGATVGKTAILKIEAATNQAVCGIFPDETKVNTEFLRYQLVFFRKKLLSERYGGAQPNISQTIIKNIRLRLPPLPEQRRIAHVLATVQTAIEQQARLIALTRELKSALMRKLFTEGLRGEKQIQTEIGLVPESWEVKQCDELCEMITVGVVVKPASYYVENGIPAFRSLNIREDRLDTKDMVFFSEEDNNTKLSKSKLQQNDVLIVRTGYPGTSCVVPKEYNGSNCIDLVIARPKETIVVSGFLSRFFNSPVGKKQALMAKHGLAQQHLNVSAVKRTIVPIPSIEEQEQIDSILKTTDLKIELATNRKALLEELFRALLHQLMTGQVRVNDLDIDSPSRIGSLSRKGEGWGEGPSPHSGEGVFKVLE